MPQTPQIDLPQEDTSDIEDQFKRVFDKLKPKHQKVLIFYFMGFNMHDIVDITGETFHTIKKRYQTAAKLMQEGVARLNRRVK